MKRKSSTSPNKRGGSPARKKSTSPAKSPGSKRGRSPSRSPAKTMKVSSPSSRAMVVVPDQEQGDILDKVIDRISILGTLSLLVAICAVGVGIFGAPDDFSLHICSLVLGAGRGGVPGCATVAGSFFVLLAPPGRVNQMLALMTVAESMPNQLVGLAYFRSADWLFAMKLNVFCVVGLALGQYAVQLMSDQLIRKVAGGILLTVVAQMTVEKFVKKDSADPESAAGRKRTAFLRSTKVMLPLGLVGGVLSFVAGNMGPLLNVYMVFLALPKYEMVGTRAAIFIPIDAIKLGQRWTGGYLTTENLLFGVRLGIVGIMGVIVAKIWLKKASKEVFAFVYNRVTYFMTGVSGLLLVTGMDLKEIIAMAISAVKG